MNLLIVESPTKARTLSRFLGRDFDVEATTGHIKDLPKSKLGIDIEHDFKPDYIEVPKRKETIENLKGKSYIYCHRSGQRGRSDSVTCSGSSF